MWKLAEQSFPCKCIICSNNYLASYGTLCNHYTYIFLTVYAYSSVCHFPVISLGLLLISEGSILSCEVSIKTNLPQRMTLNIQKSSIQSSLPKIIIKSKYLSMKFFSLGSFFNCCLRRGVARLCVCVCVCFVVCWGVWHKVFVFY